jgi:hypothetical protein
VKDWLDADKAKPITADFLQKYEFLVETDTNAMYYYTHFDAFIGVTLNAVKWSTRFIGSANWKSFPDMASLRNYLHQNFLESGSTYSNCRKWTTPLSGQKEWKSVALAAVHHRMEQLRAQEEQISNTD